MAKVLLPDLLKHLVYPGAMTALGVIGNAWILRGETKDMKAEIRDVKGDVFEVKTDIRDMKANISDLLLRQNNLEHDTMARMVDLVVDCGKQKQKK